MHRGYIKIWRKLEDSGLLQMHGTFCLFMHMLLKATHKDIRIGMTDLKRGQFISGRHQLAAAIKLTEQQLRTCEKKLHNLNMIDSKSTNQFTIYTIVNYESYQDSSDADNKPITNEQQTGNKRVTTIQEHKHISTQEETLVASDAGRPSCPHEQIIALYHEHLPTLPGVKVWTAKRKESLKSRWMEDEARQNLEFWSKYFRYVATSDFLTGRTGTFQATLEWLVNSSNFVKVIEGNYENRKAA